MEFLGWKIFLPEFLHFMRSLAPIWIKLWDFARVLLPVIITHYRFRNSKGKIILYTVIQDCISAAVSGISWCRRKTLFKINIFCFANFFVYWTFCMTFLITEQNVHVTVYYTKYIQLSSVGWSIGLHYQGRIIAVMWY